MKLYYDVAVVTLLTALVYFWMAATVARTHSKVGILAPTMTGDPLLERTIRAHYNTLEWMPVFLPSLWLFAIYWNSTAASILGLIWIVSRIVYFLGYAAEASKRQLGFLIQTLTVAALLFGALGRLIYLAATGAA